MTSVADAVPNAKLTLSATLNLSLFSMHRSAARQFPVVRRSAAEGDVSGGCGGR